MSTETGKAQIWGSICLLGLCDCELSFVVSKKYPSQVNIAVMQTLASPPSDFFYLFIYSDKVMEGV